MREFTTVDLNKQVGEVTDAAREAPVVITRHKKPKFVLMSIDHYRRIRKAGDHRRVYGPGETPPDIAELFGNELDRLSRGDGYDAEP